MNAVKGLTKGLFFLIICSLFLTSSVHSQGRGSIVGRVTDESTGDPLPGANVFLVGTAIGAATDLDDRSVDLNMISPEILSGIEVIKALTPDKDADTFGGTVDFKLADTRAGGFHANFRFRGGYNAHREELGQYKGSLTLSNRFWGEKLGVLVTTNSERAQQLFQPHGP